MPSLASIVLPSSPRLRRWLLPWLLAVAALANLAYPMYVHYDFSHSLDTRSYLRMASGRFDSVNVTRRYRVLVPAAAAAVAAPVSQVYAHIWPQRPAGQWPLRFAFYLVNSLLLGAAGACWFNTARQAGAAPTAAALAMLAVLSSRWAEYAAGLPLTDSLYLLVFGLGYYAVRRGPGSGWAVVLALALGPLAKESFLFLVPWLLWFGRPALGWPRQLLALAGGLVLLFITHQVIDSRLAISADQSVSNALSHLDNFSYSFHRVASFKGLGELLSIFGLFTFIPLLAFIRQQRSAIITTGLFSTFGSAEISFLAVVAAHMLLSGDLGRMGYLATPVFCTLLALTFTQWRRLIPV
ncbi:hypothetical protein MON38_17840 [Hymenobacter sp. DH14]|uniref:Uncharacterized protein n=1 Tax=Hymenobacter cyanobacteriorum TaxID=2926463 RepID=A0A9X1VHJ1_9BACT|nr:hypothetical protein [Hymenobacter cyanobacteriorum]MCI1189289.1 hypothetical protein [Hymenobacter cyanobacteriorum]